ncbi:hypothetical protein [Anaerocellum danielii]|uniref:Uncharacterized protein n=1 Tax=Anaerocellum danielii TaxID=1387557 RepID=A0ABZ0TXP4_9FIRM|nr:hypothetical protein [Caldicellulosiruptor danielii]WPX08216.1 hypothetical protein SOJ16_002083 [Caldicellulosiruptor danielii]
MKKRWSLIDVAVDIGEFGVKVSRLSNTSGFICSEPECIESAEHKIEYEEPEETIYLCKKHFDYVKANTMEYALLNIIDSPKTVEIPVVINDKKIKVTKLGDISLVFEAEKFLKDTGILEENEILTTDVFLSLLRTQERIAYADVVGSIIFVYYLDETNDEYIITREEWQEIKERLGEFV